MGEEMDDGEREDEAERLSASPVVVQRGDSAGLLFASVYIWWLNNTQGLPLL